MKWTGLNELREMFLSFFEGKEHLRLGSFPLVPHEDKSLLLINSGMAPMKKWFLGVEEPPSSRVCTCQKCIRTPDIESVGITARHGTYFEMMGNFSFQNYFKEEAITWAWEFFTDKKWLDIPADKLHISVYEEDDTAWDLWTKTIGVPEDHMVRLGKADNFWEHGSGPCGPCSEIHYDRGKALGCGSADCKPGCECDRFMEIWNLVFTEFNSDGKGNYERLAKPNIDTGLGLERLACIMQEVGNLFEVDTVRNILNHVEKIAQKTYGKNKAEDISIRVITDHIRSTVFMVGDGVLPSNEGRGYVLRRLLRRAARHGRMLGIRKAFLADIAATVIEQNKSAYPELAENAAYIQKTVAAEEERFARTIDAGLSRLNELIGNVMQKASEGREKILSGIEAFKLNDTFGFPLDLTREIAQEAGIKVDIETFKIELQKQREKAREDRKSRDISGWEADLFAPLQADATEFVGYTTMQQQAVVVALSDGEQLLEAVSTDDGAKEGVLVVLNQSPFYAEGGGQVGDTGFLTTANARLAVQDVKKANKGFFVHTCTLVTGVVQVGEEVLAQVDEERRTAIMRNHTSVHLLQQALREVLGDHVHQAGSYVDEERARFDFTHFNAVTNEELHRVEAIVNKKIFAALPVTAQSMPIDKAKEIGAVALFGEKYGDVVRVVDAEGWSVELCGGTHVQNTSWLGSFKIVSEASVAAGVRRIEGTTGYGVLRLIDQKDEMLRNIAGVMKVGNFTELPARVLSLAVELKEMGRELAIVREAAANEQAAGLFEKPETIGDVQLYCMDLRGTAPEELRKLCDKMKEKDPRGVGVFCGGEGEKLTLAVCCGKQAVANGLKAGNIAREVAMLAGGSGGGKPDFAMAGIKQPEKVSEALAAVPGIIKQML